MAESYAVEDQPKVTTRDLDAPASKTRSMKPAAEDSSGDTPKKQTFGQAFRAAKDGSVFEWNGKKYKKEYKSDSKVRVAPKSSAFQRGGDELPNETRRMREARDTKAAENDSTSGMGSKITNRPAPGAPSPYAGQEEWAKYRDSQARGYANGGLVKRATAKSHGKAC